MSYRLDNTRAAWHDTRTGNDPFALDRIEDIPHDPCICGGKGVCDECRYQRAAANCDEKGFYKL